MARQNILSAYEKMQKGPNLGQFQQLLQSEQRIGAHKGNRSRGLWNIASQVGFGIDKKLKDWQAAKQNKEYSSGREKYQKGKEQFENDPDRPFTSGSTVDKPKRLEYGKDPNSLEGFGGFFKYLGGSGEKGKYSGWAESSRETKGYDPSGEKDITGMSGDWLQQKGENISEWGQNLKLPWQKKEHGDIVSKQDIIPPSMGMGAQDSYRGMDNVSRGLGGLFGIPTGGGMGQNSPSGEFVEPAEQNTAWYDDMSAFEKYFFNKEKNKANMNYAGGGAITGKSGEKVSGMGADTQLIVAQPGEFVIKKDAVKAIGLPYLRELNALKTNKGGEAEYGIPAGKNIFGQPTEAMTQQELMEMMLPVGGVMSGFGLLRLQSPHGKAIAKRVAEVLKKHYKKFPKDKPTGVDKITGKSGGKTGMQQGGTVGYQEGDEVKKEDPEWAYYRDENDELQMKDFEDMSPAEQKGYKIGRMLGGGLGMALPGNVDSPLSAGAKMLDIGMVGTMGAHFGAGVPQAMDYFAKKRQEKKDTGKWYLGKHTFDRPEGYKEGDVVKKDRRHRTREQQLKALDKHLDYIEDNKEALEYWDMWSKSIDEFNRQYEKRQRHLNMLKKRGAKPKASARVRNQRPVAGKQRYQYQEGDVVKKEKRDPWLDWMDYHEGDSDVPPDFSEYQSPLDKLWKGSRMGGGQGWIGYDEGQWAPGARIMDPNRKGIGGRLSDVFDWRVSDKIPADVGESDEEIMQQRILEEQRARQ